MPVQGAREVPLETLFDALPYAVVQHDLNGNVQRWNAAAEQLFGYAAHEVTGRANPTIPPQDESVRRERWAALARGEQLTRAEVRRRHRDGHLVDVELHPAAVRDASGRVIALLAAYTENATRVALREHLDERMRQQAAVAALGQQALRPGPLDDVLNAAAATVARTLDLAMVSIVRREDDGRLVFAATYGWSPIADFTPDPVESPAAHVLRTGRPLVIPDVAALPDRARSAVQSSGGHSSVVVPIGDPQEPWGTLAAHAGSVDAFTEDDVHFLAAVGNVVAAAAARADAEATLRHRAAHDALTGLPNRDLLQHELAEALEVARAAGTTTALLLIDLDGFKDVNDSQGHQSGDVVLREVAQRLRKRLREQDRVARLGGDEFAVVLAGLRRPGQARAVAAELVGLLREPFTSPGGAVSLGGSIGVALAPEHATDVHTLLQRADLAMYRAKRERSGFAIYDPAEADDAGARLWMVNDLRTAITEEQIHLAYQPVVDLRTGAVTAVEALARWTHPVRGPQSPAQFVELAERSGLAGDFTDLVLRRAARQCAAWLAQGLELPVAVNLPPSLLCSPDIADYLVRTVTANGMPVHLLQVEVTEGTLAGDAAIPVLTRLRDLGIRVAIDDFGTGWSSLGRLKQLPVSTLKIDRSFVSTMLDDPRDVAIVRAVVALADQLEQRTVAEGVETIEVADQLHDLGVHLGQGYLFARPLDPQALLEWHAAWTAGEHDWLRHRGRAGG